MNDPERPQPAKLDTDDLELLIAAIERLSAKVDAIEKNAPVFSQEQAVQLSSAFAAKAEDSALKRLTHVLNQIKTDSEELQTQNSKALFRERTNHVSDTELFIRDNRRWRLWAVGALILILAGAWLGHGYIVRTVSGCYALGGEFLAGKVGSGYPDVCWFDIGEPR